MSDYATHILLIAMVVQMLMTMFYRRNHDDNYHQVYMEGGRKAIEWYKTVRAEARHDELVERRANEE